MEKWLKPALDYIPQWIDYQMEQSETPGCSIAIAHRGKPVFEKAFGVASIKTKETLTPRHRFRVASHSKSFTATGTMLLRERGKLKLDDEAGKYIAGLHPRIASVTIAQLLSHGAGIVRDGRDTGQWMQRRPFLDGAELRADLSVAPTLDNATRFKYSNHGYGLIGLIIEAVSGESWGDWIAREVVAGAGLKETYPDAPLPRGIPLATGHSTKALLGRRHAIPVGSSTHALAAATGFVSTARDLALFFHQLSPRTKRSVLGAASRREMVRRQWRNPHSSIEDYYGLGLIIGASAGWDRFGHSGGFPGTTTRTTMIPALDLAISVLTNTSDGLSNPWSDGIIHILRAFEKNGAPSRRVRDWTGRWWGTASAGDYVPMGDKVVVATPAFFNPFLDASEITVTGRGCGVISLAGGYMSHGEPVSLVRGRGGKVVEIIFAGARLLPRAAARRDVEKRYRVR